MAAPTEEEALASVLAGYTGSPEILVTALEAKSSDDSRLVARLHAQLLTAASQMYQNFQEIW